MRLRSFCSLAAVAITTLIAGCASDASPSADSATTTLAAVVETTSTTTAPTTVQGRLAQAYPDPTVDPSADAWQSLLDDTTLDAAPLSVIEFAGVTDDAARAKYTTYIDAVQSAAATHGGTFIAVTDVWRSGLELPTGFDGGMVWAASFPTREAYLDTVLDPAVVEAAAARREAVVDPHLFVGVNLMPEMLLGLENPTDVESLPHDLVRGRPTAEVVDELLSLYQDGGADPTRATLEAMLSRDDVRTQAVTYVNLYRFGPDDGGAASINEYNTEALPFVLAHGARPKLVFNVAQQLLGSAEWNRVILVRWPSLEVFTDLRLTPGYVEAQKSRVSSSQAYGNLVTFNRADLP